jgi:hypothetical protein
MMQNQKLHYLMCQVSSQTKKITSSKFKINWTLNLKIHVKLDFKKKLWIENWNTSK